MTRARWAVVLVTYAVVALVAAAFLKAQVAPCFGFVPTGEMSPACLAAWQAQRPWWDTMFDTPIGAVVVFVGLTVTTWVLVELARRRRRPRRS